jgi:hypothetical protein
MKSNRKESGIRPPDNTLTVEWPVKMKLALAAKFLGISSSSLSNMINSGKIKYENDPIDNRVKLVKRSDLEALLRRRTQI